MPFRVTNIPRPAAKPPSPPRIVTPSRSRSSDDHSFVSSDDGTLHTALSDSHFVKKVEETPPQYLDDVSIFQRKSLPSLPKARYFEQERLRTSNEYDPYAVEQAETPAPNAYPLTTTHQLATALGPDNAPHTTEIDTVPCAGVRIPHGPLFGLLAWRLVVRTPLSTAKDHRQWWDNKETRAAAKAGRRSSSATLLPLPPLHAPTYPSRPVHSYSYSEANTLVDNPRASNSAMSLPLPQFQTQTLARHPHVRSSSKLNPSQEVGPGLSSSGACVANFILDTSLPYSIISRETLLVLGYPSSHLPSPPNSNPHQQSNPESNDFPSVTLSIQGIHTRLRIARPGEASRLGVQFLHDAGVSVFFPRNGDGVGPVLYLESARLLSNVPNTITSLPGGARGLGTSKMTLQQRVRALFGLAS